MFHSIETEDHIKRKAALLYSTHMCMATITHSLLVTLLTSRGKHKNLTHVTETKCSSYLTYLSSPRTTQTQAQSPLVCTKT